MIEIACLYPNALGADLSALGRCREAGYEAVQLHPRAFAEPGELSEHTSATGLLGAARSAGLRIAAWSGYRPLIGEAKEVAGSLAYLDQVLRFAGRVADEAPGLATPIVCTETGAPDPRRSPEEQWQQLVESLAQVASTGEAAGAKVAIEPTRRHIIRDVDSAARVLEDVGSPALGICYDPANIIHRGEGLEEGFQRLAPHILLSHAKDVRFAEDGSVAEYPPAGEGEVPYLEFVSLLGRLPGPHTLAVEYARSEEHLRRVAAFLRDLRGSTGSPRPEPVDGRG